MAGVVSAVGVDAQLEKSTTIPRLADHARCHDSGIHAASERLPAGFRFRDLIDNRCERHRVCMRKMFPAESGIRVCDPIIKYQVHGPLDVRVMLWVWPLGKYAKPVGPVVDFTSPVSISPRPARRMNCPLALWAWGLKTKPAGSRTRNSIAQVERFTRSMWLSPPGGSSESWCHGVVAGS